MNEIIRVDGVSKAFALNTRSMSLRYEALSIMRRLTGRANTPQTEQFYALKEVTFSIQRGEAVAIVGRNGSGKTTLLRLLARVMRPTVGRIEVNGRFAALIGLGAGFNPELTGRANIYLNSAIYGVYPKQVEPLVDDIIAFADIGAFIDVPVKDYSSGMNARLGFSVAVHILPEIIFVDEVLAVGDEAFQEKCISRILQMKAEGRTILFISHAAETVRAICDRALWLDAGRLMMDGHVDEVLGAYQAKGVAP